MVLIPMMESFDGILSEMTAIVCKLEKNSGDFFNESVAFVRKLENTAENYRLPIAGELAVIRGKLLCGDEDISDTVMYQNRKERRNQKQRFILRQPALTHIKGAVGAVNANIIFEKTMSLAGVYDKEEC